MHHRPEHARCARQRPTRAWLGIAGAVVVAAASCLVLAGPARASVRPVITSLSRHHGPYWGATLVTIRGSNFTDVQKVMFGNKAGYAVNVVSPSKLTVLDPEHKYGIVHVRVVTSAGSSTRGVRDRFTFTHPTMDSPIMGGLTAHQEQRISARIRAQHRGVYIAPWSRHWTPAMGRTAAARARSWLGLPYSWAGGNGSGPTTGVCAHNGGDLDCHVVGFDCSGLSLYTWSPYEQLVHYAATQHGEAGRFHPTIGQLMPGDLVFFSGYIPNGIGHVAVYVGHGMVIEAAQSGTLITRARLVDVIAASGQYRGATRPMSTGRQGPVPRITSITKDVSSAGGYVRITGRHLSTTTAVYVGGRMVYSFAKQQPRHLVVKVPAHAAGQVVIAVSNAWGTARRTLTYVGAPQLSALTPSWGPTAGGTTVTVHGNALSYARRVKIGRTSVDFQVLGPHRLTFTTPAHAAGSVPVFVRSPFGVSNPIAFTYGAPPPSSSPPSSSPLTSRPPSSSASSSASSSPYSSGPPGVPARSARRMSAEPKRAPARDGFYADRIGEKWYLIGRLFEARRGDGERSCVADCERR